MAVNFSYMAEPTLMQTLRGLTSRKATDVHASSLYRPKKIFPVRGVVDANGLSREKIRWELGSRCLTAFAGVNCREICDVGSAIRPLFSALSADGLAFFENNSAIPPEAAEVAASDARMMLIMIVESATLSK